jgi:hypothetical protein
MTKLQTSLLAAALFTATASEAATVVLGPSDALNGPPLNGSAAINTSSTQSVIGSGSWQANGTSVSQYYLYAYAGPAQRGLGQLTVADLNSISFSTLTTTAAATPDWYITIYTMPYSGGESWYGNRLVLEPYLANGLNAPANQWNTFSTTAGANQLTVNDTGGRSGNQGYYGQPTLSTIQSGPITWSALGSPGGSTTPINYASMNILGIVLSTGNPWANGFTGFVDDVNINTTHGNVQFDLEAVAVPEPTTWIAGLLLLLPVGFQLYRRTARNRA